MAGIAGIISVRPAAECQRLARSMVSSLNYEPFYRAGVHCEPTLGIYGGWTAPEGAFAATQPFQSDDGSVVVLLSGECFPAAATGAGPRQAGNRSPAARGSWIIDAYEKSGDRFFETLNGLFSGLLIDRRRKKVHLFNDRYGFERIYVHESNDSVYFASEAKAILNVVEETREFDPEGLLQFLAIGCTTDERSLFRGVRLLAGASVWTFDGGRSDKRRYFSPREWESQEALPPGEFEARFQETFRRIVPLYLESESGAGIALTAGLDTRMIMACLPEVAAEPVCYTFEGPAGNTLDSRLARRITEILALDHRLIRTGKDFFENFASHVDRTVHRTDGYFGVTGAHEVYLNRAAREFAPVRVTGVCGSELLRGTSTFKPLDLSPEVLDAELARSVKDSARWFSVGAAHPVTFAAFQETPWNIFGSLAACRSQISFRTPYLDNDLVALAYRVPGTLRNSNRPALNFIKNVNAAIASVPTDMGLLGGAGQIATLCRSWFAKATFKLDYYCNDGMPDRLSSLDPLLDHLNTDLGIMGLHKFLRYRRWFRKELAPFLREAVNDAALLANPLWNRKVVARMAEDHISGRRNWMPEINAVLTVESVQRLFFGVAGPVDSIDSRPSPVSNEKECRRKTRATQRTRHG